MKTSKKTKVLALALAMLMLIPMSLTAFAEVSATTPIEIDTITIADSDDAADALLDVTVNYSVYDGVGDQVTILATTDATVNTEGDTNIVYIDQVAKPTLAADRKFSFKVEKADFATGGSLYVKIGGTGITAPGSGDELIPSSGPVIPETAITINMNGAFGIAEGGIITIDNAGNYVDPAVKNIKVGNYTLYYNAAKNKFVGIVRSTVTAADVVVNDGASSSFVYGDVNNNGELAASDAQVVLNIYLGTLSGEDWQLLAADVNGNLELAASDAQVILNKYLGTITSFPVEAE